MDDLLNAVSVGSDVSEFFSIGRVYFFILASNEQRTDAYQLQLVSRDHFVRLLEEPINDVYCQEQSLVRHFEFQVHVHESVYKNCPHFVSEFRLGGEIVGIDFVKVFISKDSD